MGTPSSGPAAVPRTSSGGSRARRGRAVEQPGPPGHSNVPEGSLYIGAAGHGFLPDDVQASENAARKDEESAAVSDLGVSVCSDCTFGGATTVFGFEGVGSCVGADEAIDVVDLCEVVYARREEPGGGSGVGHDFGPVEIYEGNRDLVDPSMPQWGGPTAVSPGPVPAGDTGNQYGAGVGNVEVFPTKGSSGASFGGEEDAWHAGIRVSPGDSGSPFVGSDTASGPPVGGPRPAS